MASTPAAFQQQPRHKQLKAKISPARVRAIVQNNAFDDFGEFDDRISGKGLAATIDRRQRAGARGPLKNARRLDERLGPILTVHGHRAGEQLQHAK